jgi:SAM-dependent methyltransferase
MDVTSATPSAPRPFPRFDDDADFGRLRELFVGHGFTDAGVVERLRVDDALAARQTDPGLLLTRTDEGTPLDTLIRLFLIGTRVGSDAAERALAPIGLTRLAGSGLLTVDDGMTEASVRIVPFRQLYVTFDAPPAVARSFDADFVMGVGASSLLLANVVVRDPVENGADLGCGCGIQALALARHCRRVVAVDINPRAIGFTAFNARLNGFSHIECRQGSFIDGLGDEAFDIVVSNPPYVVSPEARYAYRDGGFDADGVCETLARTTPRHLVPGGWSFMTANWIHPRNADWRERLAAWFAGSGCSTLVLRNETRDVATYATTWIRHTENDTLPAYQERLARWLDYYGSMGIDDISAGLIVMRRSGGGPTWVRIDDGPEKMVGPCGDAVARRFCAEDFLVGRRDETELLHAHLAASCDLRLIRSFAPTADGFDAEDSQVRLVRGFCYAGEVDAVVMAVIAACNGTRPLSAVRGIAAAALHQPEDAIASRFLQVVRGLVERGFLLPNPTADGAP